MFHCVLMCYLCVCACKGAQHALVMHSASEALFANSYLSHALDTDSLFGDGAMPFFFFLRHEVRLANLLNLSI